MWQTGGLLLRSSRDRAWWLAGNVQIILALQHSRRYSPALIPSTSQFSPIVRPTTFSKIQHGFLDESFFYQPWTFFHSQDELEPLSPSSKKQKTKLQAYTAFMLLVDCRSNVCLVAQFGFVHDVSILFAMPHFQVLLNICLMKDLKLRHQEVGSSIVGLISDNLGDKKLAGVNLRQCTPVSLQ